MNLDIELIPSVKNSSVKARIKESLNKCEAVKGAVAYWTIDINFLEKLSSILSRDNSYYCIDIHKPTNIDYLADFKKSGSNIFLHNYDLKSNSNNYELEVKNKIPYLLHSKIILFEMPDNNVEIWVGSHNFTQRAICGVNIESSFIVRTNKDTKIYKDILTYLDFIKDNCIPFDINDVSFYKLLQGESEEESDFLVLELVGENAANLEKEKMIQVMGVNDNDDISNILEKEIVILILNLDDNEEYIYKAKILQAGKMNSQNSKSSEITFSPRRYAIREVDTITFLKKEEQINENLLQKYKYYINIEVNELLIDYKIYKKPGKSQSIWIDRENTPHLERMNQEDKKRLFPKQLKPIKCSEKTEPKLKEVSLKKISEHNIMELKSFYLPSKNNTIVYTDKKPKAIERKRIFIKRLLKKVKRN